MDTCVSDQFLLPPFYIKDSLRVCLVMRQRFAAEERVYGMTFGLTPCLQVENSDASRLSGQLRETGVKSVWGVFDAN